VISYNFGYNLVVLFYEDPLYLFWFKDSILYMSGDREDFTGEKLDSEW